MAMITSMIRFIFSKISLLFRHPNHNIYMSLYFVPICNKKHDIKVAHKKTRTLKQHKTIFVYDSIQHT